MIHICLPDDINSEISTSKCPRGGNRDKRKRVKCDDNIVKLMIESVHDMSDVKRNRSRGLVGIAQLSTGRPVCFIYREYRTDYRLVQIETD